MHMLFLDESGTPPKPDSEYPRCFVVGGLIIPEAAWHTIRDGLQGLKIRHKLRGEIKWRYFSPSNDDAKNPMRALDTVERNIIRGAIYKLIAAHKSVTTLASVVSSKAAYKMHSISCQDDIYALAYKGVTERFQYHLQGVSRALGRKEYGIIVCDQRSTKDDHTLRAEHQKLIHSTGQSISKYDNIIEGVFLSPSHLSVGIQLADMVAGAIWRRFERDDSTWYSAVEPTLRSSSDGVVDGYGIIKMPKAGWE
jgi:hypothetical protein